MTTNQHVFISTQPHKGLVKLGTRRMVPSRHCAEWPCTGTPYQPLLSRPPYIALIASIALFIGAQEIFRIVFGAYGFSYIDPPLRGQFELFPGFLLKYSEALVIGLAVIHLSFLAWLSARTRIGAAWRASVTDPQMARGEILALLGANGAGKTSTLMCLAGLVTQKAGQVRVAGANLSDLAAEQRIRHGMAIVPEGRRIFPDMSVLDNLIVGGHIVAHAALQEGFERVYGYFPRLLERKEQLAGSLSGGEQQMLAMGRALMSGPKVLLVDEMSLGLMPKVVDECYVVLQQMKQAGVAIVLVEQNTERALAAADQVLVLEAGNLLWHGTARDAYANENLVSALLGQGGH